MMQQGILKRRKIGPAYEKSPAELASFWLMDNLLRILAAFIACVLFCLAVDWIVGDLLNFMANEGKEGVEDTYSGTEPIYVGLKVCGSFILSYFLIFRMGMRGSS